ncbi:MAG TPA: outer membrane protein assembly factor BamA [Nitrospirota bacterium]|nr:outer membrane protein assembly factor BamA [Nitrospirota bacterium]
MLLLRCVVIILSILILAPPAHADPTAFSGLTITRIDLKDDFGNPWHRPDQIEELIGIKPGDILTGAAVREGIALLYLKGIFRDIIVEAFPENSGVRLEYTFIPITAVEKVLIHGSRRKLKGAVTEVLSPLIGKELHLDKLSGYRADILSLYEAAGYYNAAVSFRIESGPAPDRKSMQTGAGAAQPALPITYNDELEPHKAILHVDISEGEPTVIGQIDFSGNAAIAEKDLLKAIKSRAGSPLHRDQLLDADKEAILKKYGDEGYPAAKVGPVDINFRDHRAFVRITISEGPRVTVRFTGNSALKSKELKRSILVWSERDTSDTTIDGSVDRIKTLYRERGYADATVEAKKTAGPGVLDLDFIIDEGLRVTVRSITLQGNTAFTSKEIKKGMALRVPGWSWSSSIPFFWYWPFPYQAALLDKDVDNLQDRYLEAGYQSAVINKKVTRSRDGSEADIVISITEGPRTLTGAVTFDGNTIFTSEELLNMVVLKPGSPFNERLVDEDKYRISSAYANKGYLYSRVEAAKSPGEGSVDVRYRITEDRPVRLGRIILRGNERTKGYVIMRQLVVKPGDTYDYGALLESQQQIYHLGYFRLARFDPIHPGEKEYVKDMLFTVEERPAGAAEVGVGYGSLDRFRWFGELSHRNLFGKAQYASLRYEQSDILKRGIFNFQEPWFLNRRLDAKFSLVWSDAKRLSADLFNRELLYKTRKTSASFGIEKSYGKLKPSLTYQFENVVNYNVLAAAQITPDDSGRVLVSSLSPALIWDLRDDVFNPRRGALYGIILKEALREFFSEADFTKLTMQASWFLPIDSSVAAFSARAGMAWPFRSTPVVPLHERFYVGGNTTVRGYTQDSIGPTALDPSGALIPQGGASMAVFNLELRLNPGEGLGFVLFTDAGNAWSGQEMNIRDLRSSYGAGIRYGTPVGPLRIDYGQKISRRSGESPGELHFNIGNTF